MNVRRSIQDLLTDYENGNTQPLEDLLTAWAGIQNLNPAQANSFFMLGGFHGEPFQYRTDITADPKLYWGGWCNHGNILFPTWHRVYLYKLEQALQSVVPGVTLPYWDETDQDSLSGGVPWIFTTPDFPVGSGTPNPLYSFTFPVEVSDLIDLPAAGDPTNEYTKPAGYQTVRYPLSGLVGTPEAAAASAAINAPYLANPEQATTDLNNNVMAWLAGAGGPNGPGPTPANPNPVGDGIYWLFQTCLSAPNYTVFSNTTSAGQWNNDNPGTYVAPLEQPHNDIHLSVGGFDIPGPAGGESGQLAEANGDMGENDTAGLDPIFFFHHCNVDRMFWVWQKQNGFTESLGEILPPPPGKAYYPGTNSNDTQGPTPDYLPNTILDLNSGLFPFSDGKGNTFTSNDAVNIETQLGYTYTIGSFDSEMNGAQSAVPATPPIAEKKLAATGINRSLFNGSFVIRAAAEVGDKEYYLGHYSVLNRNNPGKCSNCLNHIEVKAHFPLNNIPPDERDQAKYKIFIQHRGKPGVYEAAAEAKGAVPKRSAKLPEELSYDLNVID